MVTEARQLMLHVRDDIVQELVAQELVRPSRGAAHELTEIVRAFHATVEPLHPGTGDRELATHFQVHGVEPERMDELRRRLESCSGVLAAYVKTTGGPPAGFS